MTKLSLIVLDPTFWVYGADILVCVFGFFIFIWWWVRQKTASEVYAYITFLLLSISLERIIALSVRCFMYHNFEKAANIIQSPLWSLRTIPSTLIIFLIVFRMARRACRTIKLQRKYMDMDLDCQEVFDDDPS